MGSPNSDPPESPAPDTNARHRTRLTNLLWRQRYASGELLDSDGDGIIDGIPLQSAGQRLLMDEDAAVQPTPKRMIDSYCQVVLPFASDLQLREEYVNVYRGLRLGKLMEDLDAL